MSDDAERQRVNPWHPMTKAIDLKHLGKLAEEAGELVAAASRCIIQGIDEKEPDTGKLNRVWLEQEIADVLANCMLVRTHFQLDVDRINERTLAKMGKLRVWHNMLGDSNV